MFDELLKKSHSFLDGVFQFIEELKIDVSNLEIDHIALGFKKTRNVDKIIHELTGYGDQISAAIVNGRKIIILKFLNFSSP